MSATPARGARSNAWERASTACCGRSSRPRTASRATPPTTRSWTGSGPRSSAPCRRSCSSAERSLVFALLLELGAQQIAERSEALSRRHLLVHLPLVLAVIGDALRTLRGRPRQPVPAAVVDLDDLRLELRSYRHRFLVVAAARRAQLRIRHQPLAPVPMDEDAEGLALVDGGVHHVADSGPLLLLRLHGLGRLRLVLADPAERYPPLGVVDRLHLHPDDLALLHHLTGMLQVAIGERRDVHQAVDPGKELDERAERLQARDLALEPGPFLELRPGRVPGILLEGPERERDLLVPSLVPFDPQDLHLHPLSGLHHVLRMRDARVRQLGDVDQPFQSAQIDECPEVAHRGDGAFDLGADLQALAQLGRLRGALLLQQRSEEHTSELQ